MEVGRSETKKPKSSVDQQVLAAIVLNQTVAVIAAVVFENEAPGGVVEIGPTDEPAIAITEIDLDLGTGQSGLDEQPSKPSFHRRFGGGGQLGQRAKPAGAGATRSRVGV
ncbi:MAG TPA: hypothetical protein VGS16_08795 [Candidatus Dormibacteraeota bacterium]|nr:hypothetical protein [Candidatus Dormibacteraeota bacterium]